jgi:hypothetical protein
MLRPRTLIRGEKEGVVKMEGEVVALDSHVEGVKVRIGNVRRTKQAGWRAYGSSIEAILPKGVARSYSIGRGVEISVVPKKAQGN